jgi:small GTP-binding protein
MDKIEERIKSIEEELKRTERNKATEHHIGFLLAKLAKLKREKELLESKRASKKEGFAVKKQGDATVFIIGFPSVGKSSLINKLTGIKSKTADYQFTTLEAIPAIMLHKGFYVQLVDVPGIIEGASKGKGRGKEVISSLRAADLILILLEPYDLEKQLEIIKKELYDAGIRINEKKPDVVIEKTLRGGINIIKSPGVNIDEKMLKKILMEFGFHNANVHIKESITVERFIDAIAGNRYYVKAIFVLNKIDLLDEQKIKEIKSKYKDMILISVNNGIGLKELKDAIIENLDLIRIYTMDKFGNIDKNKPLVLKRGSTVADACLLIHKDLLNNFDYAKVLGNSVKFKGQKVGLNHVLDDGDIIFIKTI